MTSRTGNVINMTLILIVIVAITTLKHQLHLACFGGLHLLFFFFVGGGVHFFSSFLS